MLLTSPWPGSAGPGGRGSRRPGGSGGDTDTWDTALKYQCVIDKELGVIVNSDRSSRYIFRPINQSMAGLYFLCEFHNEKYSHTVKKKKNIENFI